MKIIEKSMKYVTLCLVTAVCGAVFFNAQAFSQGNIKFGPLHLAPQFTERIESDDNIYQVSGKGTNGSKNSDIINTYTPGLGLMMPFGGEQHAVGLNWYSDFKNYRHNADQNQQNHYFAAMGKFSMPKGFDVELLDNYEDTWSSAGSETDRLHARKTNTGTVKVSLPDYFRKFDVDFTYKNYDIEYDEFALRRANRNEHSFTVKVPFELTPKINLFPEYTFGFDNIERERLDDGLSDSHWNEIYGGVEWQATAKTTGIMKFGYTNRDFEKSTVSDVSTFSMLMGIEADLSSRTKLLANVDRSTQRSEFTSGSNAFVRTGGNFRLSHQIKKVTASMYGVYFKSVFRDSKRKDDDYTLGADLTYNIKKWSFIDLKYSYKDKHSNFEDQSDRINKASIGIGVRF